MVMHEKENFRDDQHASSSIVLCTGVGQPDRFENATAAHIRK